MDDKEDVSMPTLESHLRENHEIWMKAMAKNQFEVDILQDRVAEVEESLRVSQKDSKTEMEILWRRVKTTTSLLTYLKSKARTMAAPDLAHSSFGVEQQKELSNDEKWMGIGTQQGSIDEHDGAYVNEMLRSVQMVADVMETLVRRVIIAESVTAIEKDKVMLSQEEIQRKAVQIESMSLKLEEMERFALGTNSILNDMRQRVEDLVEETTRQKQRATENEEELCRVKRDFESLKSYVKSLISVRETLISSEKQFQTIERLFERLAAKTTQLEGEKMQKEAEVQKLMEENVRLTALIDKKEAQLVAMNEQCKMMAVSASMNSK